jgi:hypothetical protein
MVGKAALAAGAGLAVEPVDQVDDVEEAAAGAAPDAGPRDADRQMGLARARRSSDILPSIKKTKRSSATAFIHAMANVLLLQVATGTAVKLF